MGDAWIARMQAHCVKYGFCQWAVEVRDHKAVRLLYDPRLRRRLTSGLNTMLPYDAPYGVPVGLARSPANRVRT
jgi:hypothetical protein